MDLNHHPAKPCRSILSVPGHIEKMHSKALASKADIVMLDLEDSVPCALKIKARKTIIHTLINRDLEKKTVALRINPVDTPFAFRDIIEIVESAGAFIDYIVIPKVNHSQDIGFLGHLLSGIEMEAGLTRKTGIEASIETAAGLEQVSSIAGADHRMASLSFGVADYSASIGSKLASLSGHGENEDKIYPGHLWHFPLSRMIMAAKANDLLAFDAPFGSFKDIKGLEKSAAMARALGCDGKWVIHPDQIPVVNKIFTPSQKEIQRAGIILDEVKKAGARSRGAVAVEGKMIDLATKRLARKIWNQALGLGLVDP